MNNKMLSVLVGILILIVGIQSFFLFKLYNKSVIKGQSTGGERIKEASLLPQQQTQKKQDSRIKKYDSSSDFGHGDDWDPFKEMQRMRSQMDQMFQHGLNRFHSSPQFRSFFDSNFGFLPDTDMQETDTEYVIQLDLPGMDKASIDVKIEGRLLTISGTRNEQKKENKGDKFFRQERTYGQFSRSFTLPGPVDDNGLKAEYKNGVLTVIVPKAKKNSSSKQIPIL